jgi:hypothetical protein
MQGKPFFEHPRPLKVFENAVFAPLLQVPPTQWGEPKRLGLLARFPPLCEGNRAEVRFPLLREGNQKGSVPPACRGNLQEGVRHTDLCVG